jgi:tetratricopeptide (TPR) repeat protein
MDDNLPIIYLSGLLILLASLAVFVIRQIIKTRSLELTFAKLQRKLSNEKGSSQEYYELGSIYLDKKLYIQSVGLFQKALKVDDGIEPENKALIYNALGYAYFAQEQYDLAIRNYKEATKLYPEYVTALNNLGNVYEKKQMVAKSVETYEQALKVDPQNNIAKRRSESLRKRLIESN